MMKLEGIEDINKKIAKIKNTVDKDTPKIIRELTVLGQTVAKETIDGGLGSAKNSIKTRIRKNEGQVLSLMNPARAESIEKGRSPGELVPYMQAARYVTSRRYLTSRRLSELSPEDHAAAKRLQDVVLARGAKGKFYIQSADEVIRKAAPKDVSILAGEITKEWGK